MHVLAVGFRVMSFLSFRKEFERRHLFENTFIYDCLRVSLGMNQSYVAT